MNKDNLLEAFVTLRVMDDPISMRNARVALGTASFGERWRHFWHLPPTAQEIKFAESSRKMHEQIEELKLKYGNGRTQS